MPANLTVKQLTDQMLEKHKEWGIPLVDAISKARKLVK